MLDNKNQQEADILFLTVKDPGTLTKHFITRHLNEGADINGTHNNGKSILTIVTQGYLNKLYDLDMVYYLLTKGADPFLQDNNGNSVFSIAIKSNSKQLLRMAIECINIKNTNEGADINGIRSNDGESILTIVTQGYLNNLYDLDMVYYLLTKRADPFLQDNNGNSMFSIAIKSNSKPLLRIAMLSTAMAYIIKGNLINPNDKVPEADGKTYMHIMAEFGMISRFLMLLRMNGKVDINDDIGNAPLDIICSGINKV